MNRINFDTSAGNRRVSELIERLESKSLIPRPDFQRRLVWTTLDKNEFLRTVLQGYPFPEIYIAANKFDIETAKVLSSLLMVGNVLRLFISTLSAQTLSS